MPPVNASRTLAEPLRWQALIFDLDDTLYPERAFVLSGLRAVAVWLAGGDLPVQEQCFQELAALYESGVRGNTFDRWLAGRGRPAALAPQMVQVYREHRPDIQPFPGVPDLLARLRPRCRLGLVSDGYLAVQQRKLAALSLAGYFDAVVFSDAWGRAAWKPSTRPFEAALAQLDVAAAGAVYVADNASKDFLGARQLGMATIWLRRPGGEYAHLAPPTPAHAPDLTITSLDELEGVLARRKELDGSA